jgi:uncharacterized protein (DUF362 family)
MTRREWLALISAAPLLNADAPVSPVSIAKCASYDEDVTAKLGIMFDQIGSLSRLVRNKTVTVKLNMTGGPGNRLQGLAPAMTHYVHPKVVGATAYHLGRAGAKRIRFVESPWATTGPLEDVMLESGWKVRELAAVAPGIEFENTNGLARRKKYARFRVPGKAYMYPEYVLSQAYEETDVFVSLAKLKEHADCGITLSLKNCFGCVPASIYGDDAGVDEPNESPTKGRSNVVHFGRRQPSKIAPPELYPNEGLKNASYRVSRVVADLAVARPIDLAIIDGIESMAGGEGPWIRGARPVKPGVLLVGLNPVSTDTVGAAVMGHDPRAFKPKAENTLLLAEAHDVGAADLSRIEVRGVPLAQAVYKYR